MEIVYCEGCGKSLRETEFTEGKAQTLNHRHYCVRCKPLDTTPRGTPLPSPKQVSTARLQRVRLPRSTARAAEAALDTQKWVVAGGAMIAAALVALVCFVAAGRRNPETVATAPMDTVKRPVAPPASTPSSPSEEAAETLRKLESLVASGADPATILEQCDLVRKSLKSTPYAARLTEIEEQSRRLFMQRENERKLGSFLESIDRIQQGDPEFARAVEVQGMLSSALRIAGSRETEVQTMITQYNQRFQDMARGTADQTRSSVEGLAAEQKYEEALQQIDAYPEAFRSTPHWDEMQALRKQIDEKKAMAPPDPPPAQAPPPEEPPKE